MNVSVTILGRVAVDAPFVKFATTTIAVDDAFVPCMPAAPPAADGQDLALRITSDDTVTVQLGQFLDPATRPGPTPIRDDQGTAIGEEPALQPFIRGEYVAWGHDPRHIPFRSGKSIVLFRPDPGLVCSMPFAVSTKGG